MKNRKRVFFTVIAIAAILFCVAVANIRYISTPRVVIKFDGKPASNVILVLPRGSGGPYRLDTEGSITVRELGSGGPILIPKPDGGGVSVGFPQHGTKVVDIRDRVTLSTVVQYFGLVSAEFESFNLTDQQVKDIQAGRKTQDEVLEEIQRAK
jgi:hypothetical protein